MGKRRLKLKSNPTGQPITRAVKYDNPETTAPMILPDFLRKLMTEYNEKHKNENPGKAVQRILEKLPMIPPTTYNW